MTIPRCVTIRHVLFEDLGHFADVLTGRGWDVSYLEAGVDPLHGLDPLAADLLVVLGGPIGAYEDDRYPLLRDELRILETRMASARPTLGICLGAQLMARALGARVYPGPAKEIGWAPLALTAEGRRSALCHLDASATPVLHWHGDTFDLPAGATRLASTPITANQAFSVGANLLGLQFHAEADARRIEQWLIGHACEISGVAGLSLDALRAESRAHGPALARQGRHFFGQWLDGLDVPRRSVRTSLQPQA
jgi:GMP synthase (glutamine-hydrolysing)